MTLRRKLSLLCAGMLLGAFGLFLLRGPLTQAAVTEVLRRVGAGEIKVEVTRLTPWVVQLEKVDFKIKAQKFSAARVTLQRAHWWQPTLGEVRIDGVRLPVTLDGSDTNPFAWGSYAGEAPTDGGGLKLPLESLSVAGQLIVRTMGHEQALDLQIAAKPGGKNTWTATLDATGPGILCKASGSYGLGDQRLTFQTSELAVELKPWQDFFQRLVVLPLGPWTIEGRLTGAINGTYQEKTGTVGGRIGLSQGRLQNASGSLAAEGIESDFEFTDLLHVQSKPGTLRVHELRAGKIVANDLEAEVAFASAEHLAVNRATLKILGGSLAAEPFKLALEQQELEAVVLVDNLDVEKILALSKDVPAKGSGRVDGRLPIRIDEHGLRLGTGWLQLKPGVYAEMQINAAGLITSGMSPSSSGYVVMKRVESGLLRLKLGALRLDVRPPDAPRGRSARLHLEGDPVDPSVKAPVILDLNVNGPLEQLLNFGLQQNISMGAGK